MTKRKLLCSFHSAGRKPEQLLCTTVVVVAATKEQL